MSRTVRTSLFGAAGIALLATAVAIPSTSHFAGETSKAHPLATLPAASLSALQGVDASVRLSADMPTKFLADDGVDASDRSTPAASASNEIDADLMCMAKVVHHEAGNQPRDGQLAVAQLIMNRLESGRFASTICGVVHQAGQFFDTNSYNPSRATAQWATALAVAREARDGIARAVVPKALFYHASSQGATRFFRTRERVAVLGDHIFYR